ncbi:DUF6510 family protein [Kribbella sp. NPDC000426]|uniref:DUF6510 family protein n=1 Tax=Kribbella sp. NPDC000426 TaxID=3154255 RepID=UPI0033167FEB
MTPYDGNAIAGVLEEVFGHDMTAADCVCAECGRTGVVAEVAVYLGGPGAVARCRSCDNVLLVITERRAMYCVDLTGFSHLATP